MPLETARKCQEEARAAAEITNAAGESTLARLDTPEPFYAETLLRPSVFAPGSGKRSKPCFSNERYAPARSRDPRRRVISVARSACVVGTEIAALLPTTATFRSLRHPRSLVSSRACMLT